MANNNIEQYLEAMLAALDGDTVPDVPSPSWNIEKYLAAILTKLSSGGGGGGGSGGGVLVVHDVDDTLDKTWQEIRDAMLVGGAVIEDSSGGARAVALAYHSKTGYIVSIPGDGSVSAERYSASSTSDYPVNVKHQ